MAQKLSKDRIMMIDHLKEQAFQNTTKSISKEEWQKVGDLTIETLKLIEVFEVISEIGIFLNFYETIDDAFTLLLENEPENQEKIFRTYKQLTRLFRVIEKNENTIVSKQYELKALLRDLDILETDSFQQPKGLQIC
ncbi:hypothetical protein DBR11_19440 [Pedobacter sp. HMWF019]|uniref:hypothetical protein n=1 Tax=Pedobacter sp. HMWF019 TaxID=2056856 RepID=UPI000D35C27C|nr:hypothetical protein [Pedobacter sp. HMWF019]PTS96278.1 hypothetical protein DBR11_19440 [Pedobacter sp. HMWF019]